MPEVAIPVKETEETMADEITEGKTEDRYEFIDSSDSGYGIWDEDKMTTKSFMMNVDLKAPASGRRKGWKMGVCKRSGKSNDTNQI